MRLSILLGISCLTLPSLGFPTSQQRLEARTLSRDDKIEAVKEAFRHGFNGYMKHAYPNDELKPVSNGHSNPLNGWGATSIDSLSTALLMELQDVVDQVLDHVQDVDYTKTDYMCSLFETTIRYLGGMISGYDLLKGPFSHMASDDDKVEALLKQSQTLADVLKFAFKSKSGIPWNGLNITAQKTDGGKTNGIATIGTLVLEWTRLSDLTKNPEYGKLAQDAEKHLLNPKPEENEPFPGLIGSDLDIETGLIQHADVSWEAGDDSFYEYLLKMYIYDRERFGKYKDRWVLAADSSIEHLKSSPSSRPDLTYIAAWEGGELALHSQHLACFAGGNFILGGRELGQKEYIDFGLQLVEGCYNTYNSSLTRIGPESFAWDESKVPEEQKDFYEKNGFYYTNAAYGLRPEVIESYYYAYRITGETKYQDWAWEAFVAINATTRTDTGFSNLKNVNAPDGEAKTDDQPSFLFAETFKYIYLTVAPDAEWHISPSGKDKWVYNTEAHPIKVKGPLFNFPLHPFIEPGGLTGTKRAEVFKPPAQRVKKRDKKEFYEDGRSGEALVESGFGASRVSTHLQGVDRGIPPGPPCLRCRREQRNCQFSEDRAWARKKKKKLESPEIKTAPSQIAGDGDTPDLSRHVSLHDGFSLPSNDGDVDTPSSTTHMGTSSAPAVGSNSNIHQKGQHYDSMGRPAQPDTPTILSAVDGMSPMLASSTSNVRSEHHRQTCDRQPSSNNVTGLPSSVMRTVVSSGNDALNILFQAAAQEENNEANENGPTQPIGQNRSESVGAGAGGGSSQSHPHKHRMSQPSGVQAYGTPGSTASYGTAAGDVFEPTVLSNVEPEVLAVWDSCRFVKMGWFSSREGVTYIDLFFKNMAPLSPILSDFYSSHRNHYWLITQEPVLCCTILMISSRYHTLPGVGGASRGFFIHQRLWQHCQHLIMRVMLGQEKGSKAKTRTVGTIEALLVMSEWHPRSLHFPPESDGWDSDLMVSDGPNMLDDREAATPDTKVSTSNRWLEDVIEPARRSDRMSWMLLGSGLTLAHELGVFDTDDSRTRSLISSPESDDQSYESGISFRRHRIRQLLYVFINQLASRLGCMSLMPQSLNHAVLAPLAAQNISQGEEWQSFMLSWIELTKLAKSVTDMFFPSANFTKQQLHSGRYIGLLDHFRPLLSQWRQKYLDTRLSSPFRDMIFIEYQFVRVYTNSIGMQAVVERVLAESDPDSVVDEVRQTNMDEIDYEFVQEVIDGSCHILQKVITLAESGALRFSPVRIFLRVTSSSIFLLKALSLGVRNAKLQESLDILTRSIQALRSSSLDDIHLASRYATLLESLVFQLRRSFVLSNKNNPKVSRGTTRPSSVRPLSRTQNTPLSSQLQQQQQGQNMQGSQGQLQPPQQNSDISASAQINGPLDMSNTTFEDPILSLNDINADDWLSLPFDPSMAPFGDGNQAWSGVEGTNLNFIWNLNP